MARLTESDCACVPYRADEDFVRCERCGYGCTKEASAASAPSARPGPVRARPVRFVTLPDDAPSPAERDAAKGIPRALAPESIRLAPDVARVRRVLAELRPDAIDPLIALPETTEAGATMSVRDSSRAAWDHVAPAGYGQGWNADPSQLPAETSADRASLLAVYARAALVPVVQRGVLWWMRRDATLSSGLRGLYVDCGLALAPKADRDAWGTDLARRREGANRIGSHLVAEACAAWDRTSA